MSDFVKNEIATINYFQLVGRHSISALSITMEEYCHQPTGARHLHLASDDYNNSFMVSFLTVPSDSTGVAHILEHTVLSGSRRYPLRSLFFSMEQRSLCSFMNALTGSEWTAYPFVTNNRKDFHNLIQVYLDSVFFPRLDPMDFSQEGYRIEPVDLADPNSDLIYKGVVYNEMKGAMNNQAYFAFSTLKNHLFPTLPYQYNSGGEPLNIPTLTHEALVDFHRRYYHPSNATFITYGDIPADTHQIWFQQYALNEFTSRSKRFSIRNEQRFHEPLIVETPYASNCDKNNTQNSQVILGWLLSNTNDSLTNLSLLLLCVALLDNSASPLRYALENSSLGIELADLSKLTSVTREIIFSCGLKGVKREDADQVEALVLNVLQDIANNGLPQEQLEAAFHQLELSLRRVNRGGAFYGLQLMLKVQIKTIHGADPLTVLDLNPILETLHQSMQEPHFASRLIRTWLLDNPHRVRLTLYPDPEFTARQQTIERLRLDQLAATLDQEARLALVAQAKQLAIRQKTPDNVELLPKVGLEDISSELSDPIGEFLTVGTLPVAWYNQSGDGLLYQSLIVDIPALNDEEWLDLSFYDYYLTEMGCGERDYLANQTYCSTVTGGIHSSYRLNTSPDDFNTIYQNFFIMGDALVRNKIPLTKLLRETLQQPRFDELRLLRECVSRSRINHESTLSSSALSFARLTAGAGFSIITALNNRLNGPISLHYLQELDDRLNDKNELVAFAHRLTRLGERLANAPRRLLVIGETQERETTLAAVMAIWGEASAVIQSEEKLTFPLTTGPVREGLVLPVTVNYCVKAYPTVPYGHPDAPALQVLGSLLQRNYLNQLVREQGGAYGVNAYYSSTAGLFYFTSNRDPELGKTLQAFDHSLEWLVHAQPRQLEEAILNIIKHLDHPVTPVQAATSSYLNSLKGWTTERYLEHRSRLLSLSLNDLREVANRWLVPDRASVVVASNRQTLDREGERLGLVVKSV